MAIISFSRLAITWSLFSLATNVSGVAAKGRGGHGGGSSGTCYDDQGYPTSCNNTNVGAIVGVVVGCVVLFIICAFITHKRKQKKVQTAVKANPPKAWNPTTNATTTTTTNANNTAGGWAPSTGGAAIVTGTPAEKAATTTYNIGTGATGGQKDVQAYAPPTSGPGNDNTEIVAIMVYPANTYSPPNTYNPYASHNPYAVYAPPTGPPTGYSTSSPPAPPFKQPPGY